jgi:hypothetical protein
VNSIKTDRNVFILMQKGAICPGKRPITEQIDSF